MFKTKTALSPISFSKKDKGSKVGYAKPTSVRYSPCVLRPALLSESSCATDSKPIRYLSDTHLLLHEKDSMLRVPEGTILSHLRSIGKSDSSLPSVSDDALLSSCRSRRLSTLGDVYREYQSIFSEASDIEVRSSELKASADRLVQESRTRRSAPESNPSSTPTK